jgi:hydrogenase-4 component E
VHPSGPEPAAELVVLLALAAVGVTRLKSSFVLYGLQTVVLGGLAMLIGVSRHEALLIGVGCGVVMLKGLGVPLFLARAARKIECTRDQGTALGPPLQLLLAIIVVAFLVLEHPLAGALPASDLPSFTLLLIGMLLMLTRRLAISQSVGFLVLENGAFLYAIGQPYAMPFLVETGVLLDVLAGTMIAGLIMFQISRSFEHIDVTRMTELRG